MLKTLPNTPERAQQELALQIALGVPLQITKGPGAVEVGNGYRQARQLCRQAGQPAQLFQALWGLWRFYRSRAEFQTARELADELLSLAQQHADPALVLQAHHAQWTTLINMGELVAAQEHIDQGIALYAPQHHATAFLFGGHDPGVCAHASAAFTLWPLGYPDQALVSATNALTLAQELSHAPSLAITLENAAGLHKFRREAHDAQTRAEALITLATEQRSDYDLATGSALQGWALAELGQREDGLARMRQGLASRRPQGSGMEDPHFLALPAEALLKSGHAEEGLSILAKALAVVTKSGMRFWEAEVHRLKGELLLRQSGAKAEGEACFRQALHLARRQNAKSVEPRAVISLSRLLLQQGKQEEARQKLAEIYGWFTEGLDTPDLTEAKALLEMLS